MSHNQTTDLHTRLERVRRRIQDAAQACGRDPGEVALVAVSKTQPASAIRAMAAAGQRVFGESYLQEALDKIGALADLGLEWHFIGRIQSNKTREVAVHFDWVHSVDRLKIATRLDVQRPPGRPPLNVCLQVDLSGEPAKGGVEPAALARLAVEVTRLPKLRLRGLMAIPRATTDPAAQRAAFARLRGLLADLNRTGLALDTLSMGMSADLEAAVAEGATLVRIGTDLFGPRQYKKSTPRAQRPQRNV